MAKALLVIDMLNDFLLPGAPLGVPAGRNILPRLKKSITRARKAGIPVIYICDSHRKDDPEFEIWPRHCVRGTKGAEVAGSIEPEPGDFIIKKTTYSGFYKTKLDALLRELKAKELILTGLVTNICVLYTASEAVLRGYSVVVLKDAVAGLSRTEHEFALRQMRDVLKAKVLPARDAQAGR